MPLSKKAPRNNNVRTLSNGTLQSQVELAIRSRQIAVSVLVRMITCVTEGGHTFGGYGICITGVHQPASCDDIRYVSAMTTMEIVHAVARSTAFLSEHRYVKADTAVQQEEHNAVMVMDDIVHKRCIASASVALILSGDRNGAVFFIISCTAFFCASICPSSPTTVTLRPAPSITMATDASFFFAARIVAVVVKYIYVTVGPTQQ